MDTKTQLSNSQHHPLPRRLLAGPPQSTECGESLHRMQHVCTQLDFTIAENKIEGPTTTIIFLGVLLDSQKMELRLPQDKLDSLLEQLQHWKTTKNRATKRELLSLIGKLSFATKVVPAGRIFQQRL